MKLITLLVAVGALVGCSAEEATTSDSQEVVAAPEATLTKGKFYCGVPERELVSIGLPTPMIFLPTISDEGRQARVALKADTDPVAKILQDLEKDPTIPPGASACVRASRDAEAFAFGRILHIDSLFIKPAAEPAGPP